jgi:hypothetical protein
MFTATVADRHYSYSRNSRARTPIQSKPAVLPHTTAAFAAEAQRAASHGIRFRQTQFLNHGAKMIDPTASLNDFDQLFLIRERP